MKQLLCLSLLVAVLTVPAAARADAWADLEAVSKDFYLIDKEAKGPITCHIRSSALDEFMEKVPAAANMVADQIDSFSVTAKPDGNVTFVTPRIKIPGGSYDAAQDLQTALDKVIAHEEKGLWRLLKGEMSPRKEDIKDLVVTHKDGKTIMSMSEIDFDGSWIKGEVAMAGDADVGKEVTDKGTVTAEEKYTKLDGKYALGSQTSKWDKPNDDGVTDASLQVKYQQVGKVWFPARIIDDVHIGPRATPGHIEISLTGCTGQ